VKFTIVFGDGSRIDDEANTRADIAEILRLQRARQDGHHHLTVGVAGGWVRTVGDITDIVIGAAS